MGLSYLVQIDGSRLSAIESDSAFGLRLAAACRASARVSHVRQATAIEPDAVDRYEASVHVCAGHESMFTSILSVSGMSVRAHAVTGYLQNTSEQIRRALILQRWGEMLGIAITPGAQPRTAAADDADSAGLPRLFPKRMVIATPEEICQSFFSLLVYESGLDAIAQSDRSGSVIAATTRMFATLYKSGQRGELSAAIGYHGNPMMVFAMHAKHEASLLTISGNLGAQQFCWPVESHIHSDQAIIEAWAQSMGLATRAIGPAESAAFG